MTKKDTIRILKNQVCDTCVYKDGSHCAKGFNQRSMHVVTCQNWWSYTTNARMDTMQKYLDSAKRSIRYDQARNN